MARVLITGGCGFIGSHLAESLARAGDEVTVLDAAAPVAGGIPAVRYLQADVRDEAAVGRAAAAGTDVVYHLSAVVGVDRYLTAPADVVEINLLGTRNVLRAARARGAKVVVASTSEVYGKNPQVPWPEDADRVLGSTATERWSYATSKALAEHLTFGYIRQHGVRASIVRIFNAYGPRQRPAYVVSRSIHRALRGLPPELYDDGAQTRCFTYVADTVAGITAAAASDLADGEHFNIGSSRESTVAEVVDMICELTGISVPARQVDTSAAWGTHYEDIQRRVPDTRKARDLLGWEATTSLRDGLALTIDWARRNPWWLETQPDTTAPPAAGASRQVAELSPPTTEPAPRADGSASATDAVATAISAATATGGER
jgi:dTDP-alpha-D-glucuronic acid decarboxylase